MQTMIATKIQACPTWVKGAARTAFALLIIKGSAMLATTWLALRGFEGL